MLSNEPYTFSNQSNSTCCFFDDPLLPKLLPTVLIVIFVLGSLFNGTALWAFLFHIKTWNSSIVYLFNLSVADFLVIVCLPFRIDYYLKLKTWVYGDVPCRVMLFMFAMNRAGGIFFLTLVGLDRYFRVVYPLHKINSVSIKAAVVTACVVWFIAISVSVFILTKDHIGEHMSRKTFCESFMVCPAQLYWHDLLFITEFFIPLGIVLFCSFSIIWKLRQRNLDRDLKIKKAVKCISLVGVVFFICFLPSVSTRIEVLRLKQSPQHKNCNIYQNMETAFFITICLTYMNSMCNPLIYYMSSPSLRTFYLQIVMKLRISLIICLNTLISKSSLSF